MNLGKICDRVIKGSFYPLFFLVPLLLTPFNYELFEFNKMMAVYFLTIIILGAWLIKMITKGEIRVQRTPLDFPILLFLIFNFLSFIFSVDPHVSLWGYYSRFHGGLLSTISYIILYYAFVSNFGDRASRESERRSVSLFLHRLLTTILISATLVSAYGILEHFGVDKDLWVQDVQNRVFSTLGQPNWLAAYLAILLPISVGLLISKIKNQKILNFALSFCILLFYICLLFTKSRSGFLAFWISNLIFIFLLFILITIRFRLKREDFTFNATIVEKKVKLNELLLPQKIFQKLLIVNLFFLVITFFIGSPFGKINQYFSYASLRFKLFKMEAPPPPPPPPGPALETGVTGSDEIRRIVWKGAWEIARQFPLFGTGVETFAFAYYRFRPVEHNLTSEWDFLYNKAHNEYLNYAATTGFLGLGSHLLMIGSFLWWGLNTLIQSSEGQMKANKQIFANSRQFAKIREDSRESDTKTPFTSILLIALLTSFISILLTNFFGFSVVVVALFFWLIPAFSFVLWGALNPERSLTINLPMIKPLRRGGMVLILLFTFYFLLFTLKFWYADTLFATGNNLRTATEYAAAYASFQKAVTLNPNEPLYHDKLSATLANLSLTAFFENEASLSANLLTQTLSHSQKAITISPQNVNFWKTRTRLFYSLSTIDQALTEKAIDSLLVAQRLAPTDAKITYNLALLYAETGETEKAIETLKETIDLKSNYRDARFALALFNNEKGLKDEAKAQLKYILEKINPEDQEVKAQLKGWGG